MRSYVLWAKSTIDQMYLIRWAGGLIPHIGVDGGVDSPMQAAAIIGGHTGLRAACIFHDWQETARTLQVTCASISPYWATRYVLKELLFYVFQTNKTRKLWMSIPHTSENVIGFNKHLGFKEDGVLRFHFSESQHAVILSMLEDEYCRSRWFMGHGQA